MSTNNNNTSCDSKELSGNSMDPELIRCEFESEKKAKQVFKISATYYFFMSLLLMMTAIKMYNQKNIHQSWDYVIACDVTWTEVIISTVTWTTLIIGGYLIYKSLKSLRHPKDYYHSSRNSNHRCIINSNNTDCSNNNLDINCNNRNIQYRIIEDNRTDTYTEDISISSAIPNSNKPQFGHILRPTPEPIAKPWLTSVKEEAYAARRRLSCGETEDINIA